MKTSLFITAAFVCGVTVAQATAIATPPQASKKNHAIRVAGLELLPVGDLTAEGEDQTIGPEPPEEPISFTAPLTVGGPQVVGKTLEQLILGTPLFSPIAGLPPEVWKDKKCSDCHGWAPKSLCTQGSTYLKENTAMAINKDHPYGGGLKLNLKFWAMQGCE